MKLSALLTTAISTTLLAALCPSASAAFPAARCGIVDCQASGGGLALRLDRHRPPTARNTAQAGGSPHGLAIKGRTTTTQFLSTPACPGNDPNRQVTFDGSCFYAVTFCATRGLGGAPFYWIWSRKVSERRAPTPWLRVGQTCLRPASPARNVTPPALVLTRGMVQRAFRQLDFARPLLAIQPPGGQTLVNFETYYRVRWPSAGVGPREIATVTLLGRQVRIRPSVRAYTYAFGDGTGLGPTSDAGGTYPGGRIRHVYSASGSVRVRARATYTGDFSVDGGAWEPVDETVTIAGPVSSLRVREATNQLEAGSDR